VRELTEGIEGTPVLAGIIGEIGTSAAVHPVEEKVLGAAARAQEATGAAITLHLHPYARRGHDVLAVLESEGADPARVVMGHLDNDLAQPGVRLEEAVAYHASLADRGCFIQYDCVGNDSYYPPSAYSEAFWLPSDRERVEAILRLFDRGYERRLLLSHDICKKSQLTCYGGVGYAHVLRQFVEQLRNAGLDQEALDLLLVENPRRMLAGDGAAAARAPAASEREGVR
jgi:phosphotriesterase-related protein